MGGTQSNCCGNPRSSRKDKGQQHQADYSHENYIHTMGGKDRDKDMRKEKTDDLMRQLHSRQRKLRR